MNGTFWYLVEHLKAMRYRLTQIALRPPQRADRVVSDFKLGVVMGFDHQLSGAASGVAKTPVRTLRTRQHAAEVVLVATADDLQPVAALTALPGSGTSRTPIAANGTDKPVTRTINYRTSKGLTRYLLQRLPGVLYVERQQSGKPGTQTIQSVRFGDAQGFEAWCDEDPVRFSEPHLLAQVQREGKELLQLGTDV